MNDMKIGCKSNAFEDSNCHVQEPPLSVLMDETTCLAGDALTSAYIIGQHMFGMDEPKLGELQEVRCFQDVLVNQAVALRRLNEALACIMSKLGV